jgi:hypothetical protein
MNGMQMTLYMDPADSPTDIVRCAGWFEERIRYVTGLSEVTIVLCNTDHRFDGRPPLLVIDGGKLAA